MSGHQNGTVLLLKAPKTDEPFDSYIHMLESEGFKAVSVPALTFSFINLDRLHEALQFDEKFSGLVLTSPRSVEAVRHCFVSLTEPVCSKWSTKYTFVVGNATSLAAKNIGLKPSGSDCGNASLLAPFIENELNSLSEKERCLLMPCGQLALETLPNALHSHGIQVECLTVYETIVEPLLEDHLKNFVKTQGCPAYIVFFSPSIVRFSHTILDRLGLLQNSVQLVAIGPSTENEMKTTLGRVSGTAAKPTAEHVCHLIKQLHSSRALDCS